MDSNFSTLIFVKTESDLLKSFLVFKGMPSSIHYSRLQQSCLNYQQAWFDVNDVDGDAEDSEPQATLEPPFQDSPIWASEKQVLKDFNFCYQIIVATLTEASTVISNRPYRDMKLLWHYKRFPVFILEASRTWKQDGRFWLDTESTVEFRKVFTDTRPNDAE